MLTTNPYIHIPAVCVGILFILFDRHTAAKTVNQKISQPQNQSTTMSKQPHE